LQVGVPAVVARLQLQPAQAAQAASPEEAAVVVVPL
jgi:hypothetical protein